MPARPAFARACPKSTRSPCLPSPSTPPARSSPHAQAPTRLLNLLDPIIQAADGLPLALELAATRLTTPGPAVTHSALDDALSASSARLSPRARQALGAAATYAGDITFADLHATGAVPRTAIPEVVSELVDSALLAPSTVPGRFSLLATTRRWVRGHTAIDPEWLPAAARHRLKQAEARVTDLHGPQGVSKRRQLRRMEAPLRSLADRLLHTGSPHHARLAVELLLVTGPAVLLEGPADLDAVDRAVSTASGLSAPTLLARALCLCGALHHLQGRPQAAIDNFGAALTPPPPVPVRVEALFRRGWAHIGVGDLDEARHHLRTACDCAGQLGDRLSRAIAECGLGVVALEEDDPLAARRALGRAQVGFAAVGHPVFLSVVAEWTAMLEALDGDPDAARAALDRARAVPPQPPPGLDEARLYLEQAVGCLLGDRTHPPTSPGHLGSAAQLAVRVGNAILERETTVREGGTAQA